jgi:hypothetical protein
VPGTAVTEPETPGVELENLEIPGVEPEDLEPPEMEPEDTGVGLEIPGVGEEPPIPRAPIPGVPIYLPGVQGEEGGDNPSPTQNYDTDDDSDGPRPPLSPRSEGTHSDSNNSDNEDEEHDEEIPDDEVYHPDTMTPSIQTTYGLRPKRARDYSHLHANIVHAPRNEMTQYSLNRGGYGSSGKRARKLWRRNWGSSYT